MKKAYICSPYRGDVTRNIEYAKQLTRLALTSGLAPITPHLYITQVLDDLVTEDRKTGIDAGLALLDGCDVILIGCGYGISEGMRQEMVRAATNGLIMIYINSTFSLK